MSPIRSSSENPAWRGIILNSVFNFLTAIIVGLRLWSRRLTQAGLGWDDGFIVIATLLVNAMLIIVGFLTNLGFGLPMHQVSPNNLRKIAQLGRTFRFLFLFCICFVRLSALFFYLRVFGKYTVYGNTSDTRSHNNHNSHRHRTSSYSLSNMRSSLHTLRRIAEETPSRMTYMSLICVVIVWSSANLIQEVVVCGTDRPMCARQRTADLGVCMFNAGGDLLILLLPLRPIWRLHMEKDMKVGLTIVLLLGIATIVVAFLRFDAIVRTDYGGDYSATAAKSVSYAILEPNLAILCISLPMLRPLLREAGAFIHRNF